jgi:hypothetical protein
MNRVDSSYTTLNASRIADTIELLEQRVRERFPNASLVGVAHELAQVARTAMTEASDFELPIRPIRAISGALIVGLLALVIVVLANVSWSSPIDDTSEFVQTLESAVNDVIFVGLAVFFLAGWEARVKRARALTAIHKLRSLAHVVDMHQLTKDPEALLNPHPTLSSPERTMTRFELVRYLDYCSELLSLTSKVAALYVQHLPDPQVQASVNEVVTLTTGLSSKVWQKIMILDDATPGVRKSFSP